MPPGLTDLTGAQQAMVDFLRIDADLLSAAGAQSSAVPDERAALWRWVAGMSISAKDAWLRQADVSPFRRPRDAPESSGVFRRNRGPQCWYSASVANWRRQTGGHPGPLVVDMTIEGNSTDSIPKTTMPSAVQPSLNTRNRRSWLRASLDIP